MPIEDLRASGGVNEAVTAYHAAYEGKVGGTGKNGGACLSGPKGGAPPSWSCVGAGGPGDSEEKCEAACTANGDCQGWAHARQECVLYFAGDALPDGAAAGVALNMTAAPAVPTGKNASCAWSSRPGVGLPLSSSADDKFRGCRVRKTQIGPWEYPSDRKRAIEVVRASLVPPRPGFTHFTWNTVGQRLVRNRAPLRAPFLFNAKLRDNGRCSNHFVVITTDPNYEFTWGPKPNTVKFVWNCDVRTFYGTVKENLAPCNSRGRKSSNADGDDGAVAVRVRVDSKRITFEDNRCGEASFANLLPDFPVVFERSDEDTRYAMLRKEHLYVYYGGQGTDWTAVQVVTPDYAPYPVQRLDVVEDRFDW